MSVPYVRAQGLVARARGGALHLDMEKSKAAQAPLFAVTETRCTHLSSATCARPSSLATLRSRAGQPHRSRT